MLQWLHQNLATLVVGVVVAGLLAWAVYRLVADRKKGRGCCGGCSGCPHACCCDRKNPPNHPQDAAK